MQSKKWFPFGGVAFLLGLQDNVSQRSSLVSPGGSLLWFTSTGVGAKVVGGSGRGLSEEAVLFVVAVTL